MRPLAPVGLNGKSFDEYGAYVPYNSEWNRNILISVLPPTIDVTKIPLYVSGVGFLDATRDQDMSQGFVWFQPPVDPYGVGHYVTAIPEHDQLAMVDV